ncbi:MAG: hypothetical protein RLZZ488_1483 [Pseudomonadota bacterium]|jgi:hypothetical protein
MNGKKRTIVRLTLILFYFHPELATGQSQKSQIWRIPVLPEDEASDSSASEDFVAPVPERSKRFDDLKDPFEIHYQSPADRQADSASLKRAHSTTELLRELGVQSIGLESSKWSGGGRLSLRGSPASEPTVSVDGVLLSSGFTGSHSEELIPTAAVGGVIVYPFFPSAGFPYAGMSGGYDFRLLSGPQKVHRTLSLRIELPRAWAAGGRSAADCTPESCLQISWGSGFLSGPQRVFDDGNTPQIESDDTFTNFSFNDVKRVSTAATYMRNLGTGSILKSAFLAGGENRGTSGLPLKSGSPWNRLSRRLVLFTQGYDGLSPASGIVSQVKVGVRMENAQFMQDLQNGSSQIKLDERNEDFQYISGYVSLPLFFSQPDDRVYFRAQAERSSLSGRVGLTRRPEVVREPSADEYFSPTELSGELLRGSVGLGFNSEVFAKQNLKSEISLHGSDFLVRRKCGVFSPAVLCTEEKNRSSRRSMASLLDWRKAVGEDWLVYAQAGQLERTPTPLEIAGRPDGILGNPSLQSESATACELGMTGRWGKMAMFAARDFNLITPEQVSPFLLRYENTAETQRVGLAGEVEIRILKNEIQAGFEMIDLRVRRARSAQRVVPFAPSERFKMSLSRDIPLAPIVQGYTQILGFRVQAEQTGSFWLDSQGTARLDPPLLISMQVSAPFQTSAGVLQASLHAGNLLDERFSRLYLPAQAVRRVGWSQTPVLPVQGRTFEFSLSLLSRAGPE